MKALFVTLVFFGALFAGYDYFMAPPGEKVIFKALNVEASPTAKAKATQPDTTAKADAPPAPNAAPTTTAGTVADTPPPMPKVDAPPTPAASTGPHFEPLETLAKGWTMIPKTAFPRQIHLKKAVPFTMSVGSATINAGATVTALGFENGQLTVAPAPTSSARARVTLDDTDIKAVLEEGYAAWKIERIEWLKKAQSRRDAARASGDAPPEPGVDPAIAPTRASDGSYPALVASLNAGEVNEIKVKNIHNWGDPQSTMFEGKPAWSVKIQFDAQTVFGLQPAEAQAIVSGGRVKGWYYTGSGEPVP